MSKQPSKKDLMRARAQDTGKPINIDDIMRAASNMRAGVEQPPAEEVSAAAALPAAWIVPDPVQPRRAMPELLRSHWLRGSAIEGIFAQWEHEVRDDFNQLGLAGLDWTAWIEGRDDRPGDEQRAGLLDYPLHPDSRLWVKLLHLASSICQVGLETPISVYPVGEQQYQVLVGERRLLSFRFLTWLGYSGFEAIPALVRDGYNPFVQAAENGARQDLNAIGVARQLAILLKAMNDQPLAVDGQATQSWYASALELTIPYGRAEDVAVMLGLSSPRSVRLYRQLLALPRQVWNWADQFDWPEGKLRLMVRAAANEDELIRMAQDEAMREMGQQPKQKPRTLTERVIQHSARGVSVMHKLSAMSDDELQALPASERKRLIEAARQLIDRMQ